MIKKLLVFLSSMLFSFCFGCYECVKEYSSPTVTYYDEAGREITVRYYK